MYDDVRFYAPSDHREEYEQWRTQINLGQTDLNFQDWMSNSEGGDSDV